MESEISNYIPPKWSYKKKCVLLEIIGGIIFVLGMCICFHKEWNLFIAGILLAIIGFITLLCIIPIYIGRYRLMHLAHSATRRIIIIFIIILASLILTSFGISKLFIADKTGSDIIFSIIPIVTGIIGSVIPFAKDFNSRGIL